MILRFVLFLTLATFTLPTPAARADSFWDHNGSLMRLQADGTRRWFTYENPRQGMRNEGVVRGTLLFDGERVGDTYRGTMRAFSAACAAPMTYAVQGYVASETLVVFEGDRPVFRNCRPTGAWQYERLEFRYRAAATAPTAPAAPPGGARLDIAQVTELAISVLLGDPYGRTRSETRRYITGVHYGPDPVCGGTAWIVSVFVPRAAAFDGGSISGMLAIDGRTGEFVCTNLPLLD